MKNVYIEIDEDLSRDPVKILQSNVPELISKTKDSKKRAKYEEIWERQKRVILDGGKYLIKGVTGGWQEVADNLDEINKKVVRPSKSQYKLRFKGVKRVQGMRKKTKQRSLDYSELTRKIAQRIAEPVLNVPDNPFISPVFK